MCQGGHSKIEMDRDKVRRVGVGSAGEKQGINSVSPKWQTDGRKARIFVEFPSRPSLAHLGHTSIETILRDDGKELGLGSASSFMA